MNKKNNNSSKLISRIFGIKKNIVLKHIHQNTIIHHSNLLNHENRLNNIIINSNSSSNNNNNNNIGDSIKSGNKIIGAFKKHANGELLGYIIYNKNDNLISSLYCIDSKDKLTQSLLIDDAILHMNGTTPIKIKGTFQNNIDNDYLKKIYSERESGRPLKANKYQELSKLELIDFNFNRDFEKYMIMKCNIEYIPNLAQESHEKSPSIHFHLSNNVGAEPFIITLSKNINFSKQIDLKFKLKTTQLPSDCLLNIDIFAKEKNELNQWCYNQAGYSNIRLIELIQSNDKIKFDLKVPNSSNKQESMGIIILQKTSSSSSSSNNTNIGSVIISDNSTGNSNSSSSSSSIVISNNYSFKQVQKHFNESENKIENYIYRNREFYSRHPPTYDRIDRVTVFKYKTRPGYTIGSLFDLFPIAKTKEEYYLNALNIAVGRRSSKYRAKKVNLMTGDFLKNSNEVYKCAVVMDMLTLYVNYCPYITDEIDHNKKNKNSKWNQNLIELIESFDILRARNAGDCEDSTGEVLQEAMEIKYHYKDFQSKIMRKVQKLCRKFIFTSVLCGVSNQSMNGSEHNKNLQLNGHEAAFAIPKSIFYTGLERYQDTERCELLDYASPKEKKQGSNLPIFILEGTGDLQPEPSRQSREQQILQSCITSSDQIYNATSTYHYDPSKNNNFYKVMITFITPEFYFRFGAKRFEFLICYAQKNNFYKPNSFSKPDVHYTRGVLFTDLINISRKKNVCIAPSPKISNSLLESSYTITKDDYPILPLELPKLTKSIINYYNQINSIQVNNNSNLFRSSLSSKIGSNVYHKIYIKFSDMNPSSAKNIEKIAHKYNLKVFCRIEPIRKTFDNDIIGGYEITFVTI